MNIFSNPYATGTAQQGFGVSAAVNKKLAQISQGLGGSGVSGNSLAAIGGVPGIAQQSKLGSILGDVGAGTQALGGLASIYLGFQANKLAKKNFNFQRDAFNTNLQNTVKSHNTSLEDRVRARHNTEGRSASETNAFLDRNRLSANTVG